MSNIKAYEFIKEIKEEILSLGKDLEMVEGVYLVGSLARGSIFGPRSDIDIVVILKEKKKEDDIFWYKQISKALARFKRGVTVLVYSVKGIKEISNWYVLRLASEGIPLWERRRTKELLAKVIECAHSLGLKEVRRDKTKIWTIPPSLAGKEFELKL
jgi:predicted nucleotidyltransferase